MRVIACGTGMPTPRLKQAAACFLVELGNGEKFIFDMGEGSYERISALGIPLDQLDKVFLGLSHQPVSTGPGQTALTLIPRSAVSLAKQTVREIIPALDAA